MKALRLREEGGALVRFRIDDSSIWATPSRWALVVGAAFGSWLGCTSYPTVAGGSGGALEQGGAACASPSCGTGAHGGIELALNAGSGGKSQVGGSGVGGNGGSSGNSVGGVGGVGGGVCQSAAPAASGCVAPLDDESAGLCNGLDDDCDGSIDEGCPCQPGAVQPCFTGAPGSARRRRMRGRGAGLSAAG